MQSVPWRGQVLNSFMLFYVIALQGSLQVLNLQIPESFWHSLRQVEEIMRMLFVSFGLLFGLGVFPWCTALSITNR